MTTSPPPVSQVESANIPPPARVEAKLKGKAETPRASTSSFEDKPRNPKTPDPTKPHGSVSKEIEDAGVALSTPGEKSPGRASTSTEPGHPESPAAQDDVASLAAFGTSPITASGVPNDPGKPKTDFDVVLSIANPHTRSSSEIHKPLDRDDLHSVTQGNRDIKATVTMAACIHGEWSQDDPTPASFLLFECRFWWRTNGNRGSSPVFELRCDLLEAGAAVKHSNIEIASIWPRTTTWTPGASHDHGPKSRKGINVVENTRVQATGSGMFSEAGQSQGHLSSYNSGGRAMWAFHEDKSISGANGHAFQAAMLLKRGNNSPFDIHISCRFSKSEGLIKMSSDWMGKPLRKGANVPHFVPGKDVGGEFFREKKHSLRQIMADLDNMVEVDTGLLPEHVLR